MHYFEPLMFLQMITIGQIEACPYTMHQASGRSRITPSKQRVIALLHFERQIAAYIGSLFSLPIHPTWQLLYLSIYLTMTVTSPWQVSCLWQLMYHGSYYTLAVGLAWIIGMLSRIHLLAYYTASLSLLCIYRLPGETTNGAGLPEQCPRSQKPHFAGGKL